MFQSIINNKEAIKEDIINVCQQYNIDVIVTLAKKGVFLFQEFYEKNLLILPNEKAIPIYSDRIISKRGDFDIFNNKNILFFDDTLRTGNHFKHTISYLSDNFICGKIICYCIAKCIGNNGLDEYYSYIREPLNYREYYKFCLDEVSYFQKKLLSNSVDLPEFELQVKDIDKLINTIDSYFDNIIYEKGEGLIGLNKVNIDTIFVNLPSFMHLFDGFIVALTCRVRYERKGEEYLIKMIPFAITKSIKYDEIIDLYERLFDEIIVNHDSRYINNNFVKYYRYVNYYISYYIGAHVTKQLNTYDYYFEYKKNGERSYGYDFDYQIRKSITDYNYNIYKRMKGFKYTPYHTIDKVSVIDYSYEELNETIFNKIIDIRSNNSSGMDIYTPVILESFANAYDKSVSNLKRFCKVLINNLECYLISNEIEIKEENNVWWILRGFMPGETSMTSLPYDARIFFAAINCLYEKVNHDYDLYQKNYDIFINYYLNFLKSEESLLKYYTQRSLLFFYKYFKNIYENEFEECFESKYYLLDDNELKSLQDYETKKLDYLLTSSKFTFNQ
ncbi:hypothetical protein [Thomasclavelia spiroformis]|uniref:hypothetical protein n=1 Tax=Thomasclavelia spiroformis TaxID=29348 RepID=UPI00255BB3E7|nr:hypothetical protein [Thomasclavelia spiroformis]